MGKISRKKVTQSENIV